MARVTPETRGFAAIRLRLRRWSGQAAVPRRKLAPARRLTVAHYAGEALPTLTLLTLWLLFLLLATALDEPVAKWVRDSGTGAWMKQNRDDLAGIMKLPGEYSTVLLVAAVVLLFHPLRMLGAVFVLLSTSVSGLNGLIKWVVGRHRPYTWEGRQIGELRGFDLLPFRGGFEGLMQGTNLAFPSGHTALAFATATALAMLWPGGRIAFYLAATLTAAERVLENAHWLSDVVGGAGLGVIGVNGVAWLARKLVPESEEIVVMTTSTESAPAVAAPVMREIPPDGDGVYLSLVIPAYNEQENIPTLLSRVASSLERLNRRFEVFIVDDGSTDQTPQLLADGMRQNPWLRVLRMGRNGGQSAAFEAGFNAARGEIIATIDADLQNDPEEIPRLVPMLAEMNVDMITGWRKDRQDTGFRRWQSRQANRIRNWISKETVNDSASSLKLYRAHAIRGMKLFNGAHRFFPTLVKMRGYSVFETPVKHSPRFAGTAKYGFRNRALRAFVDLLAVRWMKVRYLRYQVAEVQRPGE